MFDQLVDAATGSRAPAAVGAWAQVENAACARRLAAIAEELERLRSEDGSADRELWCIDNWDAVAASVAAAQNVSLGVASHQLGVALELGDLPRVAQVFAAGAISYRVVAAVIARTRLIADDQARAKVDCALAARISGWGPLSAAKTETEIDYWVDRYDPAALRRSEDHARGRYVDVHDPSDGSGTARIEALLFAPDADALDQRLDAMARAVCDGDPRTLEQRRSDALGALGHGGDRLACGCDDPRCDAAGVQPSAIVVHVVADEESLTDDTAVQLDGESAPGPTAAELRQMTIREALTAEPDPGVAASAPAVIIGGAILPAPLLAAKLAHTAKIVPITHPGNAGPEPRYIPSAVLATFVRCRDLTCRFPGCDAPADVCDVDHTIAVSGGADAGVQSEMSVPKTPPAQNILGLARPPTPRRHGGVDLTARADLHHPPRQSAVVPQPVPAHRGGHRPREFRDTSGTTATTRGLMMPRRKQTRAEQRAKDIADQRRANEPWAAERIAERNKPPPF